MELYKLMGIWLKARMFKTIPKVRQLTYIIYDDSFRFDSRIAKCNEYQRFLFWVFSEDLFPHGKLYQSEVSAKLLELCIEFNLFSYNKICNTTRVNSEKNPSSFNKNRTYHLLITSSNALPLSYWRLVEVDLGSWDKNPTYCQDVMSMSGTCAMEGFHEFRIAEW